MARRTLLERLPYPENLDHHFAVDPAKWDFYSMDCYRLLGASSSASTENNLASNYAREVIRMGTDHTGSDSEPAAVEYVNRFRQLRDTAA
jgi:hypothetical protein